MDKNFDLLEVSGSEDTRLPTLEVFNILLTMMAQITNPGSTDRFYQEPFLWVIYYTVLDRSAAVSGVLYDNIVTNSVFYNILYSAPVLTLFVCYYCVPKATFFIVNTG